VPHRLKAASRGLKPIGLCLNQSAACPLRPRTVRSLLTVPRSNTAPVNRFQGLKESIGFHPTRSFNCNDPFAGATIPSACTNVPSKTKKNRSDLCQKKTDVRVKKKRTNRSTDSSTTTATVIRSTREGTRTESNWTLQPLVTYQQHQGHHHVF